MDRVGKSRRNIMDRIWDLGPDTLLNICAKYCIQHLTLTLAQTSAFRLKPNTYLPKEICEKLLEYSEKDVDTFDTEVLPLFMGPTVNIETLNLRNSTVSDDSLEKLLAHKVTSLDIHNCTRLTPRTLDIINRYSENLKFLCVGNTTQIFPETLIYAKNSRDDEQKEEQLLSRLLTTRRLLKLTLWGLSMQQEPSRYMSHLTNDFIDHIQYLDLSGCVDIENIDFLSRATCLTWLNLYNVTLKGNAFAILGQLKQLRHLDISQSNEIQSLFRDPNEILTTLVKQLPNLVALDISGTNLAGRGVQETRADQACDIPGLNSRVGCPLEFLGLYGTHHDASHRHHIPAKRIAGDRDETQILTAISAYMDRHELLEKVLNDLFHLFRAERGTQVETSLKLILTAMSRHEKEKHVQISGSASLFYIVKNEEKSKINPMMKKAVLSTLINAMEIHRYDPTMMRNGCLTICHFQIPQIFQDDLFNYEKLVALLLDILSSSNLEQFVERIAIYLLNSLACQVEGPQKKLVGDLGAISVCISIIQDRLGKQECDDVMEIAWSTMWNLTDERPENCKRFLDRRGMELFLKCLHAFPDKSELRRNMMGLLGNVAEVQALRSQLMTSEFITVFYNLLDSTQDNIEVSYNAAGVLAHILSDGTDAWKIDVPLRDNVLSSIRRNIKRWDIKSQRNINYRSFEPILRLLNVEHTTEVQFWAAWALGNLTQVYPDKYVVILEKEGGLELLSSLRCHDEDVNEKIQSILSFIYAYKATFNKIE